MVKNVFEWISINWIYFSPPLILFIAFMVVSFWIRRILFGYLEKILSQKRWEEGNTFLFTTRTCFFHWCTILGAYMAIQISPVPFYLKTFFGKILGGLFILSLMWTALMLIERVLYTWMKRIHFLPSGTAALIANGLKITFILAGAMVLLDIWVIPTTPLMMIFIIVILIALFAGRDEITNIFSGIEIARNNLVKTGDYIKLDSGEEGYISKITKTNIHVSTTDGKILLIPNNKILRSTVTILRKPLKQATQPFRFYARLHLKELTGLKARNLQELVSILKDVDDSVVYYHTHNFIEEFQYLTPQPANDFALWVSDALGDQVLAEKLANVDTFEFSTIGALRERLINVMNEELSKRDGKMDVPDGREFHFIRSLSAVVPTYYVAHDLREFIKILEVISLDTLYFHILEARLRLHKGVNDFSIWINDCLGERELADKIAILDPYTYTLEGLRSMIIRLVERHIEDVYAS